MRQERSQEELLQDLIEIEADDGLIAGAFLVLIGAILNAIGITQVLLTKSPRGAEGVIIGNGVASIGNVMQAVAKEELYFSKKLKGHHSGMIGSLTQAVGNAGTAVVVSEGLDFGLFSFSYTRSQEQRTVNTDAEESEASRERSEILRRITEVYALTDFIQGVGAYIEGNSILSLPPYETQQMKATGDYITAIGSFIQAFGLFLALSDESKEIENAVLQVIGSWIQVIGSSQGISATGTQSVLHTQKYRYSYRRHTT